MAKDAGQPGGSLILLEEYFAAGNPAFLAELRAITDPRRLVGIVEKWKNDPRPFARDMMLAYFDAPLNVSGHNVVVKRLFKAAEARKDTPVMSACMHAFDVLVRRQVESGWRWDSATRSTYTVEELKTPRDNLTVKSTPANGRAGQATFSVWDRPRNGRLFSYRTRYYLRRRAWRYFRFLGYRNPEEFVTGVAAAVARYTDAELAKGEHILDSWCLLNACYRYSPALEFTPTHVKIKEGSSLNDLSPAPKHIDAWKIPPAAEALWSLVSGAKARLVRLWAMTMLKTHHADFLARLTVEHLLPLFDSFDDETQQFAAQAMEAIPSLPSLPLDMWMRLLTVKNPGALALICDLMARHVAPERLDLRQTILLTISQAAPIAKLGLTFLKTKTIATPAERHSLSDLSLAQCEALAGPITAHALSILGQREVYDVTLVSRFFDASVLQVRHAAWEWLVSEAGAAGYQDAALWSRLLETPYEETRLKLVKALEARAGAAATITADQLAPTWTAVLLGIHRGGRHKIVALHQISRSVVQRPDAAPTLVPVLAIAMRSVRPAEARVGLAAVVEAAEKNALLLETIARLIPELRFISAGATS